MEERRDKRNIVYFIISYVINNLASGVLYDTFVNYLQEAQTSIATSFWAFYGYATFINAAFLAPFVWISLQEKPSSNISRTPIIVVLFCMQKDLLSLQSN